MRLRVLVALPVVDGVDVPLLVPVALLVLVELEGDGELVLLLLVVTVAVPDELGVPVCEDVDDLLAVADELGVPVCEDVDDLLAVADELGVPVEDRVTLDDGVLLGVPDADGCAMRESDGAHAKPRL